MWLTIPGARLAWAIGVLGHQKRYARVGDIIKAHVKEASPDATVKKGEVVTCVVVRTRSPLRRADGSYLRFDSNAVVIIDDQQNPKGTRILARSHASCAIRISPRSFRSRLRCCNDEHYARQKNDMVVVLSGEHKGKVGKVLVAIRIVDALWLKASTS